jgi:hypothetical protein
MGILATRKDDIPADKVIDDDQVQCEQSVAAYVDDFQAREGEDCQLINLPILIFERKKFLSGKLYILYKVHTQHLRKNEKN